MPRLPAHLRYAMAAFVIWLVPTRGAVAEPASEVREFLNIHCSSCHGADTPEADISMLTLGDMQTDQSLVLWERVLDVIQSSEMPPEGEIQPSIEARKSAANWIETELRKQVRQAAISPRGQRHPTARRLTNIEYENTIRDLVGFRLKLIDDLPKDPAQPYRFNNTAEFMRMGPEQIDRYLECARRTMASAIVDPGKPEIHRTRRDWHSEGVDRGLGYDEIGVWGNRRGAPSDGMSLRSFPKTGEYRIRIKASAILPSGHVELPLRLVMGYGGLGENQSTHRIENVGTVALRNNPDAAQVFEFRGRIENHPARPPRPQRNKIVPETMSITPQNLYDDGTLNDDLDFSRTRNVSMPRAVVEWIEFEAPLADTWPPEHHQRILFDSPLRESNPSAYVSAVLQRFISRAYRRPVTESEVARFSQVYDLVIPELKTVEAAMRETLAMVLISPQFLYHSVDRDTDALQQYEMASRLSYFLWASMPDDELLKLASENKLFDPVIIEQQVLRLLRDDRHKAFVSTFATQWLSLEKMSTVAINSDLFPRFLYYVPRGERKGTEVPYRPTVRDYMIQETVGFVGELIRNNASVLNLVDSDFAYLNQRLAAHYGVEGVHGHELRRVPIKPQHQLGGILTHGSILIGNSTGSAPHPIYRAVWLREAILGDEVAAPPAEVPALSDSAGESAENAISIKDLLEKHRQVESCNRCHARLDPWGIPFEHYNAIGQFQPLVPKDGTRVRPFNGKQDTNLAGYSQYLKSINVVEMDASARIPQGEKVDGLRQLKAYLLKHRKEAIVENVVRRLLTYAIGRELTVHDRFVVEDLVQQARAKDYKMRDIIIAICQCETFTRHASLREKL